MRQQSVMRLYILRHAEAVERRAGLADADRRLTTRGKAQARAVARLIADGVHPADVRPSVIYTSPAARAVETAAPVEVALRLRAEYDERLGLDAGVKDALALVADVLAADAVGLLVGHNPTLEDLLERLGVEPRLKKGQLVSLEAERARGSPRARELGRYRADA